MTKPVHRTFAIDVEAQERALPALRRLGKAVSVEVVDPTGTTHRLLEVTSRGWAHEGYEGLVTWVRLRTAPQWTVLVPATALEAGVLSVHVDEIGGVELHVNGRCRVKDLSASAEPTHVEPGLVAVGMNEVARAADIVAHLAAASSDLRHLGFTSKSLRDLTMFSGLTSLPSLDLRRCEELVDVSALSSMTSLASLKLSWCSQLVDVSALSALTSLTSLILGGCSQLVDVSALSSVTSLTSLDLGDCSQLVDVSALSALTSLTSLNLSGCSQLVDVSALSGLTSLTSLDLQKCEKLVDVSVLSRLTSLTSLNLSWCEQLVDVSGLSSLTSLTSLGLIKCRQLVDVSALSSLASLTTLNLGGCEQLVGVSALSSLTSLTNLSLSGCEQLMDVSALSALTLLTSLNLRRCKKLGDVSALSALTSLTSLNLGGCEQLVDVSWLSSLTSLTSLDLSECPQLVDVSALSILASLTSLNLSGCKQLVDVSALSALTSLTSLSLCWCPRLVDVGALSALTSLTSLALSGDEKLNDVSGLSALTSLTSLDLSRCSQVVDVGALSKLARLTKLSLHGCSSLRNIEPLRSLPCVSKIDLRECPELTQDAWHPLESLPSLVELQGNFPRWFLARTLAWAAARRGDADFISKNLDDWLVPARRDASRERLLAAVGAATAILHPSAADQPLVELVDLAATHDAPEVEGLFVAIAPHAARPALAEALARIAAQRDAPLPPETLASVARHAPTNPDLRNATLRALAAVLDTDHVPSWAIRTARVVRLDLDGDPRYRLDATVHDGVLSALEGRHALDDLGLSLFGSLASDHATSNDTTWRDAFCGRLLDVALAQQDAPRRNAALTVLAAGLARSPDAAWSVSRLDDLLERAAQVDPDTSPVLAAVALAHASVGRWGDAQACVFAITRDPLRDATLVELCALVLASSASERIARALAFAGGIEAASVRHEQLRGLSQRDEVLTTPTWYGQLLGLLVDAPELMQATVARAVALVPALASEVVPTEVHPVTAREQLCFSQGEQRARAGLLERARRFMTADAFDAFVAESSQGAAEAQVVGEGSG